MPLVLPNEGLSDWLLWMVKDTVGGLPDLVFTLFVNDLVPDQETTFADLDRASFGGFQEIIMSRADWVSPVVVDDRAQSQWGTVPTEWTVTSDPQEVFGWAAYEPGSLRLMIAERFDVSRDLTVGQTLKVLPRFTLTTAPDV